ncbi:hypothetical protein SAMD00019534_118820 [Acytostelium subglobosum LB1]|uniref:hypothetical protein n=1 Tax=Acytostelium subglobosum LB1 TaxID=1410327 RepID=UPI000645054E|nr:hypothetical protein SAMD00019534_118820 [Acytostelium subglobosum LB1]GAM28706.1 hypothetical protein SAMD00019534_118820 [Acytostelium subglobosum LB1]|eukprot:XP_012748261.1 hypothetical protein SAMD00019534_118820 [Acytostelium subglobosum LB1]
MLRDKEVFKLSNPNYGYCETIDILRRDQFQRLNDMCYLDHTAATLYSSAQLERVFKDLQDNQYSNPHSLNPIGLKTNELIDAARERLLSFFNAPFRQYTVIFTSGCTDSLKMVGEYFPWTRNSSTFFHLLESHNSLLGIREYANEHGALIKPLPGSHFKGGGPTKDNFQVLLNEIENHRHHNQHNQVDDGGQSFDLLAYSAQCNYSGSKYSLDLISSVKNKFNNMKIVVDVASLVGTSVLDLSKHQADFVTLSFYKMFGYPTGLGALIVHNDCIPILNKLYFGGGTVNASLAQERFHVFRNSNHQKFEDGTTSFLSIIALKYGFDMLESLGVQNISNHTFSLVQHLYRTLTKLKHHNGRPLVTIYADNDYTDPSQQGAIINFNLFRSDGSPIGSNEVEKLASLKNIHLRVGCFCNPGACHGYLGLTKQDVEKHLEEGHVCWDDKDIMDGKPTGSIRVSLGYMSNFEDIYEFIQFLRETFINECVYMSGQMTGLSQSPLGSSSDVNINGHSRQQQQSDIYLLEINVYPVKSCGAFKTDHWEIGPSGLLYDREWTLIDRNGIYLNQKKIPTLSLITTSLDLKQNILTLSAPGMKTLQLPLDYYPVSSMSEIQVCGDSVEGLLYGDEDIDRVGNVTDWIYQFTGRTCYLVRKKPESSRKSRMALKSGNSNENNEISFSNESPFLMISEESVDDLRNRVYQRNKDDDLDIHTFDWISTNSFRANFVIKGGKAYEEDNYNRFSVGGLVFQTIGLCNRCKMICVNQSMGVEEKEPLATLSTYRRQDGRIVFGQHLQFVGPSQERGDCCERITITSYSPLIKLN